MSSYLFFMSGGCISCLAAVSADWQMHQLGTLGSLEARVSVHDDLPLSQQSLNQQALVVLFESGDRIIAHENEHLVVCVFMGVMCCAMCCRGFLLKAKLWNLNLIWEFKRMRN